MSERIQNASQTPMVDMVALPSQNEGVENTTGDSSASSSNFSYETSKSEFLEKLSLALKQGQSQFHYQFANKQRQTQVDPEKGITFNESLLWQKSASCSISAQVPESRDGHLGIYTRLYEVSCKSQIQEASAQYQCQETLTIRDLHAYTSEDRQEDPTAPVQGNSVQYDFRAECEKVEK